MSVFRIRIFLALLAVALLGLVVAAQQHRFFERTWFAAREALAPTAQARSLQLSDYRVDIEARAIGGQANVSALSFDAHRRTLVSVTNQRPHFLELSLDGALLRSIPLRGFEDPEGIEYIRPGVYAIVEERKRRIVEVHIDDATTLVDIDDPVNVRQLTLSSEDEGNRGFEGLAFDASGQRLFIAKEKGPLRIFEVDGFFAEAGQPFDLNIHRNPERDLGLFVTDLSSLYYDQATEHLVALSDESKLLVEMDGQGTPLSALTLRRGRQGLLADVPQAEGVAMDDEGNLYVVSEPNLFYRFSKQPREATPLRRLAELFDGAPTAVPPAIDATRAKEKLSTL
jgi:uncharacterized protein YjiK